LVVVLAAASQDSAFAAPFVYVANHGDDNVSIIDTATSLVVDTVPVGHRPLGVAVDPEGAHVYVSNQDGSNGTVSIITTATKMVAGVAVGNDPTGVALKLPGTRLYVANRIDRTVSVIDTATNQVLTTVDVEHNPLGVAVNPAGTPAYVVNKGSNSLTVIDTNTNKVLTTVPTGPSGGIPTHVAVSPAGDLLYVTNNAGATVSVINATTLDVTGTVSVDNFPEGVAFSPDGARAYVTSSGADTLSVIDVALQAVIKTIPVGAQPEDVSVHPDGTRVYVLNRADKTISVIDATTNAEIDVDGDPSNGITRIPAGIGPVALGGGGLIPGLLPPRFDKLALTCQGVIAARGLAFAKADQGQRTACQNRILKDVANGQGSQQAEATCALALDLDNPRSLLARARGSAYAAVLKKCGGVATAALDRPCNRAASSIVVAATCILDQHGMLVQAMTADTFGGDDSQPLTKTARSCQAVIAKGAAQLGQKEQASLGGCLLRILKDTSKHKSLALSAAACAKTLDPSNPNAALPKLRAAALVTIAKKCAGLTPADIGTPCDPAATTIDEVVTCVLGAQATRVEKMIAAEFNDACPLMTAIGLARAYPDVCTGH
jgi:YVTN family beta-propeller protein